MPSLGPIETLKRANAFIADERADEARVVLRQFLEEHDRPEVWLKLSKVYRLLGDTLAARSILRNVILKVDTPHIMDLIAARIPYTKALVVDELKLLYVNIPKCGSTSIKDAVLHAHQREMRGETSHYHVREFERVLPFASLQEEYNEYTRFTVVRDPRARLRSYFSKNILEAQSLVKEARGKTSFYGLETLPTYSTIVEEFDNYRNIFDDFRHHTDTIIGYLGQDSSKYTKIFDVAETAKAIALFRTSDGREMPEIHNMRSKPSSFQLDGVDVGLEEQLIQSFYKQEISTYFQ